MKALFYPRYGPPEVLSIGDAPLPAPGPDDVLVRTDFAGLNPVDWKIGEGRLRSFFDCEFPLIVGRELFGVIHAVGSGCRKFSIGQKVIASLPRPGGAFAEYVSLPSDDCAQAPTRITAAEAAALPLTGLTCWQAFVEKAAVEEGQVLFILSGAGGTGSLAIQIAKHLGAHVLTTCRKENESYVRSLGADEILAYDACDPVTEIKRRYPNGIDCVFSNLLGEMHKRSYALLRKGGVIVTIGEPVQPLLAANAGVREIDLVVRPNGKQLEQIIQLVDDGVIQAPSTTEFRLDEAMKAFRLSMEGHVRGKIVFSVNQGLERTPA